MFTEKEKEIDRIATEARKKALRPVGYRNNDNGSIYPADNDAVMKRMSFRETIDHDGNVRMQMPDKGRGTMVVPVQQFLGLDRKNRDGKPLWTPIYSRLEMAAYFLGEKSEDDQHFETHYKMGISGDIANAKAGSTEAKEEDFELDLSLD